MEETLNSTNPGVIPVNKKFPSKSVIAPVVVPQTTTLAKGTPSFVLELYTLPLMTPEDCCANEIILIIKEIDMVKTNLFILWKIYPDNNK